VAKDAVPDPFRVGDESHVLVEEEVAPGRAVYEVAGQRVVVTPYRGGVPMDRYTLAGGG
jgi:hypothetical protein